MAYPTIPTKADGDILTAAHMNLLADAVNFVAAVGGLPNPAFPWWSTTSTSTQTGYYWARYTNRYLHVVHNATNNGDLRVYVDGTDRLHDGDPNNGYEDHVIDCNAFGLTAGDFYQIKIEMSTDSGGTIAIAYVGFLSTSTALV